MRAVVRCRQGKPARRLAPMGVALLVVAPCAATAAGCSALVQFRDQPSCDGGLCPETDAGSMRGTLPDASDAGPRLDAASAPDHAAPCADLQNGYYCANDGPNGFAGPPSDLLYCSEGGVGKALACDGGCLHIPDPFPDACNPCPGVPDGLYCGRDLAGFPAENADFLIQCQSGSTVQQVACLHGCGSNGTMSACYPG